MTVIGTTELDPHFSASIPRQQDYIHCHGAFQETETIQHSTDIYNPVTTAMDQQTRVIMLYVDQSSAITLD